MNPLIEAIYYEYYAKIHDLRGQNLDQAARADAEVRAWNETEEKLAAAWQRIGKVLH